MFDEYRQPAERNKEAAQAALNTAKAQLTAAGKTADKNPPSAADLSSIASNQTNAGNAYSTALNEANQAAAKTTAAKSLYDESKQLADYATDIRDNNAYGMKQIGARYRATKGAATAAKSYAASTRARIKDIAKKYAAAEKKYQEAQAAALATVNSTPASGACAPSECPPIKDKQGETIQQYETRVSSFCNSLADKSITLKGAFTGIAHATSVDAIFDITYIKNGTFKPNCDKKFKAYNYNSLKCASPWFPDGDSCNTTASTSTTSRPPKEPGSQSGGGTTTKRCLEGWFPSGNYCWNGVKGQPVLTSRNCASGTYAYREYTSGGTKYKECRGRRAQGSY